MNKHKVAIVMGSQSDGTVMRHASTTLDGFEISFDSMLISAHRHRGYYDNAELFAQHKDTATFINVN